MAFRNFNGMPELEEWIKTHAWIFYHAPMDWAPARVDIRQYTISNSETKQNNRMTIWTRETGSLVIGMIKHFDRFKRQ